MTIPNGKKVDKSAHIGEGGVALIYQRVNAMGYVWHHRSVDAGVDGTIELRDPATGRVTNRFLQVQSKASNRNFPGENDRTFHYICDQRDLDYWMASDVPVLLVCSHPEREEAWWIHIQGWFADPGRKASRRVDFDKATQRFDADAATRMLAVGDPHARSHTPVPLDKDELLTSNLLEIDVPTYIYGSPLPYAMDATAVLKSQSAWQGPEPVREDFALRGERIFTWDPPESTALAHTVTGPADVLNVNDLATGTRDDFNLLIRLLSNTLHQDVSPDCAWHRGRRVLYFRATTDLTRRTIPGPSGQAREVFKPKPSKKNPEKVSYYKHVALESRFTYDDGDWYLELTPTYHYTHDGHRDSFYIGDLLSGIKRLEKNKAVLGSTRMWVHYLRGEHSLLDRDTVLGYGALATFDVTRGIDDAAWEPVPAKPASDTPTAAINDNGAEPTETKPSRIRKPASGSGEDNPDQLELFEVPA